ncbi:MAG: sigma-54 dependent transcriptional regulator [Sphaerochaetaceae bacterium]|nr:sigma-54 dependent transcriptional regulator [Sphaerochaetaceae bacterium]
MKVLIVDDETNIRDLMSRYLKIEDIDSRGAENAFSAQRILREEAFDGCVIDLRMPGMDGLQLIRWIRSEGFRMPIIMVSAHGEIQDAVEALKNGAQDYVVKPFNPEEIAIKLKALVEAQNFKTILEMEGSHKNEDMIIGQSPEIMRIKNILSRISGTSSTVLITGESGSGKEVVARSIHQNSQVSSGPFIAINIGGVPENLLESELFGHEKGAFTGAVSRKTGMFELASGGTLFLDEIGEMPLALQVKLLRVLQEKSITRLGGTSPIPINARIVCATNRNLEDSVAEGSFREDLFYRLNVVRIRIPALRERPEDIPLLSTWILKRLSASMNRHVSGFTPEAIALLKSYSFPGNVRELENVIERALIFTDGDVITVDSLDIRSSDSTIKSRVPSLLDDVPEVLTLRESQRFAIMKALQRWEGNRTKAAEELGISRRTLITKIQEFGLEDTQ